MASTILPLVRKIIFLILYSYIIIGKSLHVNNLSDDVLQEVFGCVWFSVGDAAMATVSLVCSRWKVIHGLFPCRVHFRWLSTIHDWEKVSPEFREQFYCMYRIYECLGCKRRCKDMPEYVVRGKGPLNFYEGSGDANHPGYCSPLCRNVMGPYSDPFDGWAGLMTNISINENVN